MEAKLLLLRVRRYLYLALLRLGNSHHIPEGERRWPGFALPSKLWPSNIYLNRLSLTPCGVAVGAVPLGLLPRGGPSSSGSVSSGQTQTIRGSIPFESERGRCMCDIALEMNAESASVSH